MSASRRWKAFFTSSADFAFSPTISKNLLWSNESAATRRSQHRENQWHFVWKLRKMYLKMVCYAWNTAKDAKRDYNGQRCQSSACLHMENSKIKCKDMFCVNDPLERSDFRKCILIFYNNYKDLFVNFIYLFFKSYFRIRVQMWMTRWITFTFKCIQCFLNVIRVEDAVHRHFYNCIKRHKQRKNKIK